MPVSVLKDLFLTPHVQGMNNFQGQEVTYATPFHKKANGNCMVVCLLPRCNENMKIRFQRVTLGSSSTAFSLVPQPCIGQIRTFCVFWSWEKQNVFFLLFYIFSSPEYCGLCNSNDGQDSDNHLLPFLILFPSEQV